MIPEEFISQFLWTPSVDAPSPSDSEGVAPLSLPTFRFSAGVLSEFESLASLAFCNIEKDRSTGSFGSSLDHKSLVVSSTQSQAVHVIDAAVKHAAKKQGADVLVFDALELASGRYGLLGAVGHALDRRYNSSKYDSSNAADDVRTILDDSMLPFIDALLATPHRGDGTQQSSTRRRIIYMRDFQFITGTAKPLMTCILHSLHLSYGWNYPPDPYGSRQHPDPTITPLIVFGISGRDEKLVIHNEPRDTQLDCLFLSSLFTHTRSSIAKKNMTSCYCSACRPFDSGGASSGVELSLIPFDAVTGNKVNELATGAFRMPLFAANVKSDATEEEWQKGTAAYYFRTLNQVVLRACLERDGRPLYDGSTDVVPLDMMPSTSILEVHVATRVVCLTKGLIAAAERSNEPLQPLGTYVREAYQTHERRKQERLDWEKGIDPSLPETEEGGEEDSDSDDDSPPPSNLNDLLKGLSEHARSLEGCIVDISSIPTTFGDVFVDPATIESLQTIVSLPLLFPSYFNSGVLAKEAIGGILLYGPPGTGKTMLCRALAKSSHARMLHIQPSDINDKWVGESEKKVAGVFELAYKLSPCIVFIDEIDALFGSRCDGTKSWERNILTEFMQGMDGLRTAKKNRDSNIVVVGATNRPFDLDLAILRRMPRRILVDLPTYQMRKGILGSYLQNEALDDDVSIEKLAMDTDGFSGSDLKNLCVAAALASVKQTIGPEWKDRVASSKKTLATPSKEGEKAEQRKEDLPPRKITAANIRQAQFEISKSIAGNRGDRLYKWHNAHSTAGCGGDAGKPDTPTTTSACTPMGSASAVTSNVTGMAAMQSMLRMLVSGAGTAPHVTTSSIITVD